MIAIYSAANIADAHLIRQMLEAEGIRAFIQGEYLQGAIGELPANTEILVQVGDEDDVAARAVVERWESAEVEEIADDSEEGLPPPSASPPLTGRGAGVFTVIGCLLFGALVGAAMVWTIYNRPSEGTAVDYDGDGRIDERIFFAGERIQRIEYDRNRDDKVDQIFRYGMDGGLETIESDDDFDGRRELIDYFHHNQPQRWAAYDGPAGEIARRGEYAMGTLFSEEWLDRSGNVTKSIRYDKGLPVSGEFDGDGDGRLDTARRYDRRGEIVASEPLPMK